MSGFVEMDDLGVGKTAVFPFSISLLCAIIKSRNPTLIVTPNKWTHLTGAQAKRMNR